MKHLTSLLHRASFVPLKSQGYRPLAMASIAAIAVVGAVAFVPTTHASALEVDPIPTPTVDGTPATQDFTKGFLTIGAKEYPTYEQLTSRYNNHQASRIINGVAVSGYMCDGSRQMTHKTFCYNSHSYDGINPFGYRNVDKTLTVGYWDNSANQWMMYYKSEYHQYNPDGTLFREIYRDETIPMNCGTGATPRCIVQTA